MEYRVDLDVFSGPLDLLLFLVRKHEVDIFDIPISQITDQYFEYLRVIRLVDMDVAGDFVVMASTLMEIKSRMLLPRAEEPEQEGEDPRAELVRQLLEYKRFREAAARLQELGEEQQRRFARIPWDEEADRNQAGQEPIRDVELWDLVSAFGRLMRQTLAMAGETIVYDDVPVQVCMDEILLRLDSEGPMEFWRLFQGIPDRGRLVGMFLAVLELVKTGRVRAEQRELFGQIWLLPAAEQEPMPGPGDRPASSAD